MRRIITSLACALLCLSALAQEKEGFLTHMYLPVDAGVTLSTRNGIGPAFYMRASLEYRFNVHKGPFIVAELDTHTHEYANNSIVFGNVQTGDASFADILIGPGYRIPVTESFKIALALQGGTTWFYVKNVTDITSDGRYLLNSLTKWYPTAKASMMLEYYLNPALDLFVNVGVPVTRVPVETASADPFVLFPTFTIGFSMALQ